MHYDFIQEFHVEQASRYLRKLIDKKAKIELKENKPRRSIKQNALYWYWLTVIEKESGVRKEELHIQFRAKFLTKPDEYITGIIRPSLWEKVREKIHDFFYFDGLNDIINIISEHTPEQDSKGMTIYMNKIKEFAWENMGIELLTEDEEHYREFINQQQYRY